MAHPIVEFGKDYNKEVESHKPNIISTIMGWVTDIDSDEMNLVAGINPLAKFIRDFYGMTLLIKWKRTVIQDLNSLFNACEDVLNLPFESPVHKFNSNEQIWHAGYVLLRLMASYNFSNERVLSEQITRNILSFENEAVKLECSNLRGIPFTGANQQYRVRGHVPESPLVELDNITYSQIKAFNCYYKEIPGNENFNSELIDLITSTVYLNENNDKVRNVDIEHNQVIERLKVFNPSKDVNKIFRTMNSVRFFISIQRCDLAAVVISSLDKVWELPRGSFWYYFSLYLEDSDAIETTEEMREFLWLLSKEFYIRRSHGIPMDIEWNGENDHMVEAFKYLDFKSAK